MAQRRSSQLVIAMSSLFKRQTTWDTPLGSSEMDMAFNATSRNWLTNEETVEDVWDCTNEDLLMELVTARFKRLVIDFDVDPNMLAGWTAFNKGVAANPSGGTNEVQTITGSVLFTAGTYQIKFTVNYNTQISAPVAFGANAAAITAAMEAMPNIGAGNVVATGGPMNTATPIVATFQGALADLDLGKIEILNAMTGVATPVVVETTPGVGRTHAISRLVGYTLPFTTLYVGFRGSNKQPVIFKNVVADLLRCRSVNREKVTATVQLIGSADTQDAVAFVMPGCGVVEAVRFGDCALLINGSDISQSGSIYADGGLPILREWEYYHQNDVEPKYDGQGMDVTRLERADKRPSGFNIGVLGEKGDPLYLIGEGQAPRNKVNLSLRVGRPNNHVKFITPQAILKLDNPPIRFEGRDNESNIRLMGRPTSISGDMTTPTTVTAVTKQQTAYLVAA